jgi:ketosteroid isomerase-like protein
MTGSVETVRTYNEAWAAGDIAAARALIADDLSFRGPMDTFTNAEDMVTALTGLAQVTTGIVWHIIFADDEGANVAAFYRLETAAGALECAEWHVVRDGLIRSIELRFDPRPLLAAQSG